jgi:hypothetical protein
MKPQQSLMENKQELICQQLELPDLLGKLCSHKRAKIMSSRAVKSAVLSNFNQVITFEILTQVKLFRIMVRLVAPLCAGRANHFFVKFKELQLSESG